MGFLKRFSRRVKHNPKREVIITSRDEPNDLGFTSTAYGLLVVACDPQEDVGLKNRVMRKTLAEKKIYSPKAMTSFTFQTTLIKVPKAPDVELPTVRFFPMMLNTTDGSAYGYRSETRKEIIRLASKERVERRTKSFEARFNDVTYEYVTIYQLLDPTKYGAKGKEELSAMLEEQMNKAVTRKWFPYDWSQKEILTSFHTKYFNHFQLQALQTNPNNWDILDIQGKNNTIYVHASSAFESVLHIYWYIELLVASRNFAFPRDKNCKIAIVGAGPSGLLVAHKLCHMGYTDITILEAKGNDSPAPPELIAKYAGKTQTNLIDQPTINDLEEIPAELGTCYLSPAYDKMINQFKSDGLISEGQERVSFDQQEGLPTIRDIVVSDQFTMDGPVMALLKTTAGRKEIEKLVQPEILRGDQLPLSIEDSAYYTLKGFEAYYEGKNLLNDDNIVEKFESFEIGVLARSTVEYILFSLKNFGQDRPFIPDRKKVNPDLFTLNINQFLDKYDFKALLGLFQYGYSVQGYGSTAPDSTMPAFYLLMWVTPGILFVNLKDKILDEVRELCPRWLAPIIRDEPTVTAFTKGWGDIWETLKGQFNEPNHPVNIKYGVDITKIKRGLLTSS